MGRKHPSAADRLLGLCDINGGSVSGADLLDLGEEEVWAADDDDAQSSSYIHAGDGRIRGRWNLGGDQLRHVGGSSSRWGVDAPMSAPVSVPERGRMGEEDGDSAEEWIPPHEYLARAHGKSAVATSVFEGVGRTLKGRDMRRVRDAVWSRTGYFG
ncbi:hypothetical protein HPP92_017018 [Vanilla planifolia]|uniref:Senescence regulator n=1 Tax=Vanilla planifolia TaxID=51239 RepID=A0A835QPB8_VANPL|nr:hypothetical protein HPP92_017018 [Vanilla planifolia]